MKEYKLKSCPFCGSTQIELVTSKYNINGEKFYDHYVICTECKANADYGADVQDAVDKWNKRAKTTFITTKPETVRTYSEISK